MYNRMNYILDYFGLGSFGLGIILGIGRWIIDFNYSLAINILTVISLIVGILYGLIKVCKSIKNWNK